MDMLAYVYIYIYTYASIYTYACIYVYVICIYIYVEWLNVSNLSSRVGIIMIMPIFAACSFESSGKIGPSSKWVLIWFNMV